MHAKMFAFVITTCLMKIGLLTPTPFRPPTLPPPVDCERDQNKLLSHWLHYPPDVWCISWNDLFAAGIKVIFCPFHSRFYSLVLSPQFPPRGIVILLSVLPLKTFHLHWLIKNPKGRKATLRRAIFIKAFMSDSTKRSSKK